MEEHEKCGAWYGLPVGKSEEGYGTPLICDLPAGHEGLHVMFFEVKGKDRVVPMVWDCDDRWRMAELFDYMFALATSRTLHCFEWKLATMSLEEMEAYYGDTLDDNFH